jgi:hypothetical protein
MDKTAVNEIELKYLVEHYIAERYSKKRKEFQKKNWFNFRYLPLRWIGNISERRRLFNQELSFQHEMREDLRKIIESKNLTDSRLKEYSHALRIISKKYSAESTHLLLVAASIILIFSAARKLLTIICAEQLFWAIAFLDISMFILVFAALIGRIVINETAPINEELILLIDEYVDSSTK